MQRLWRLLAVFPNVFNRDAAAAVWETDSNLAHETLGSLAAYSLIEWNPTIARYRLHELARLFADNHLSEAEWAGAKQRHAIHYETVIRAADQLYKEGGDALVSGLALFDLEWGNIQAGQKWAEAQAPENDAMAELCSAYPSAGVYVLSLRLHPRDQIRWLNAAVDGARRLNDLPSEGAHLGNLGTAYALLGDAGRAIEYFEKDLTIARELGHRRGEGAALGSLGSAYAALGDSRRSIELYEQQIAIVREIGDRRGEGNALGNLGTAYAELGETDRSIECYEQALIIDRLIGDRLGEGTDLGNLGLAYAALGETRRAIELYQRQVAISRELGERRGEGNARWNMSLAHATLGEFRQAVVEAEAALKIYEEIEAPGASKVRQRLAQWQEQQ